MIYYVTVLELVLILILKTLQPCEMVIYNYPVINISNFIGIHKLDQFLHPEYGNFTHLVNVTAPNVIYVVSNENELLQLQRNKLEYINKYSLKKSFTSGICEQAKIDIVQFHNSKQLLWFCFAYKIGCSVTESSQSMCYTSNPESISEKPYSQWTANMYVSYDFLHRTVSLISNDYSYNGIFWPGKELKIFKNPVPLGDSQIKNSRLPRYFLKTPGDFIASFLDSGSIYFLYLETDYVCGSSNERLVTRLLRLCDNDNGNSESDFSVIGKVNVECEKHNTNKAIPAYKYRVATQGHWMPLSRQLVVTFVNDIEENYSAAICVYSIQLIEDAFNSDLKSSSEKPTYQQNNQKDICKNINIVDQNNLYTLSKTFPLRKSIVRNETFHCEKETIFVEITSDESSWKNNRRAILFVSSKSHDQTSIVQIILQPYFCISRKFLLTESITLMKVLYENNLPILYVGTSGRLIKISMDICHFYELQNECLEAKDPYCYWDTVSKKCSYASSEKDFLSISNVKNLCPRTSKDISPNVFNSGKSCKLVSFANISKQIGMCNCRLTKSESDENKILVLSDCKVNGNWTSFSKWSDCSVTCGTGFQTRSRLCENPKPQFGGKDCVGESSQRRPCSNSNRCEQTESVDLKTQTSQWSSWSPCSKTCGFSYQKRTRDFTIGVINPSEIRLCRLKHCEKILWSEWSPWSKLNIERSVKKRVRFQCNRKYQIEPLNMSFSFIVKHSQIPDCSSYRSCRSKYIHQNFNGSLQDWTSWSQCSSICERAKWSIRNRTCSNKNCLGSTIDYRPCSLIPCTSTWSCWTPWLGCSPNCETKGTGKRKRHCIFDNNKFPCQGNSSETSDCPLIECPKSYSYWSEWSLCTHDGINTRRRKCLTANQCLFPLLQSKPCSYAITNKPAEYAAVYMIVSGLVGMVVGILIGAIVCYIWWRCTIYAINAAHSGSIKISNPAFPLDSQSQYDSQSLQTYQDINYNSMFRQRTASNSERFNQSTPPYQHSDPMTVSYYPFNFQVKHPALTEEHDGQAI